MQETERHRIAPLLAVVLSVLGGCQSEPEESLPMHPQPPPSLTIEASGFATVFEAPPSPLPPPGARPEGDIERLARERGISIVEAADLMNPDESIRPLAHALDRRMAAQVPETYIGMRIVQDPMPRFAFQFTRDAVATLARFTQDPRFAAIDGGLRRQDLQPLFDEWAPRFAAHRLFGGSSVMEFDGVAQFSISVDAETFATIAAREGWRIPERVKLDFAPTANPRSMEPALSEWIRVLAREDRRHAMQALGARSGTLVLRDGCFRIENGSGPGELALFGRNVELVRDTEGHLAVIDPNGDSTSMFGNSARVGEIVSFNTPRAVHEADAGVQALRSACGDDPIVAVGEPLSRHVIDAVVARRQTEEARRR